MRTGFWRAVLATGTLAIGLGAVVAFAGATTPPPPASGNGIAPTSLDGISSSTECSTALTGQDHIFGLKVQKSGALSSYNAAFDNTNALATHGSANPLKVTITNAQASGGGAATFDWSANMPVDFVYVAAGTKVTAYNYSAYTWGGHPATGPWGDTGLVSPSSSISYVLFCSVKKLRIEKTAVPSYTREYTWTIDKKVKTTGSFGDSAALSLAAGGSGPADWRITVDQTGSKDSNIKLTGVITVLDSSPFDVAGILDESLSDVTFTGSCAKNGTTTDQATFSVAKGKTITCAYSAPLAAIANGVNTVVADPTTPDWMGSTSASQAYAFGAPSREIDKTVAWEDTNGKAKGGITGDDTTDYQTTSTCGVSRKVTNTVSLYGDVKDKGPLATDQATLDVTCNAPKPLTVTKTATPSFTRTYTWKVTKTANPAAISLKDGGTGSSTWTVQLERDGAPVDSGWRLNGTIAVGNPNGFTVNGVSVNDGLGGTVTCPSSTIAANASMTCTYTVDRQSGASGTNTATATTTTPGVGSGSAAAQFAFTAPTSTVNGTVDVVDTNGKTWADQSAGFTASYASGTLPCKDETYSNTARVIGDEGRILSTSTATVKVTCSTTPPVVPPTVVPPTVVPPTPVIDIGVTKSATTPTRLNGNVTYTIVVSSLGPNSATNVEVKDPAPGYISYSSATSSDPSVTCNVVQSGALVSCNRPGTFSPGQSFVVTVVGKATKTGTFTNTVTVSTPDDSKASNNQASASTVVVGIVKPPISKPKPQICATLTIASKTVMVGKGGKLALNVSAGGKPVAGTKVRLKGAGVDKVVKTGANGRVTTTITSSKSGIVVVSITGRKGCNTARVGVVGVFEPPVTG